jgi:hypothetical protein
MHARGCAKDDKRAAKYVWRRLLSDSAARTSEKIVELGIRGCGDQGLELSGVRESFDGGVYAS